MHEAHRQGEHRILLVEDDQADAYITQRVSGNSFPDAFLSGCS